MSAPPSGWLRAGLACGAVAMLCGIATWFAWFMFSQAVTASGSTNPKVLIQAASVRDFGLFVSLVLLNFFGLAVVRLTISGPKIVRALGRFATMGASFASLAGYACLALVAVERSKVEKAPVEALWFIFAPPDALMTAAYVLALLAAVCFAAFAYALAGLMLAGAGFARALGLSGIVFVSLCVIGQVWLLAALNSQAGASGAGADSSTYAVWLATVSAALVVAWLVSTSVYLAVKAHLPLRSDPAV